MVCKDFSLSALFHGFPSSFTFNCTIMQGYVYYLAIILTKQPRTLTMLNVRSKKVINNN